MLTALYVLNILKKNPRKIHLFCKAKWDEIRAIAIFSTEYFQKLTEMGVETKMGHFERKASVDCELVCAEQDDIL